MKLLVITERGRVVGTQPVAQGDVRAPASAVLRAGPGQKGHIVDVAAPFELSTARQIDDFHRRILAGLRPRKKARKKKG